jgi:hypothetical protein
MIVNIIAYLEKRFRNPLRRIIGFSILMAGISVVAAYSVGQAQDADILPGPSLPGYTTSGTLTYGQDQDGNAFSCDVTVEVHSLGGIVWYEIEDTEGCQTMIARDDVPVQANLYVDGNLVSSGSVMPGDVADSSVQNLSFMLREGAAIGVIHNLEARVDNPDVDNYGVLSPPYGPDGAPTKWGPQSNNGVPINRGGDDSETGGGSGGTDPTDEPPPPPPTHDPSG